MNSAHLDSIKLLPDDMAWTLIVERHLPHPRERVWAALTEKDRMREWLPFTVDRNLTATGTVRLTDIGVDGPRTVEAEVLEVDAPTALSYQWANGDVLRWELTAEGPAATALVLKHRFTDRAPAPSYAAGWHLCLDSLGESLAGDNPPVRVGDAAIAHGYDELYRQYSAVLG